MKTTSTQNEILDYKIQEYQDRIDELKDRNNELREAVSNNKDYNAIYEIYENECRIEEYMEKIEELESKRSALADAEKKLTAAQTARQTAEESKHTLTEEIAHLKAEQETLAGAAAEKEKQGDKGARKLDKPCARN